MIVFENNQEIDIRSISTFGVSVKESDNPIGFFGTGLKYAIAVLLRTKHEVTIFSGESQIVFGTSRNMVRGQEFEFITMSVDGAEPAELGFTTELGKQWDLWMAYREIACNCKDEGGAISQTQAAPDPVAGRTAIIVTGHDFESVYANRHEYIVEDEPSLVMGSIELFRRPSNTYFYRSVRVHTLGVVGLFTYNDTAKLDLTEDRTVKYQWQPRERVALAYLRCEDERLLKTILTADSNTLEGQLSFSGFSSTPSETFLRVVGDLSQDRLTKINQSAIQVWKDATNKSVSPRTVVLTPVQKKTLDKALDFCSRIGFNVRDSYPISAVESLGQGTLGMAVDDTIFISIRTFDMGTKYVAGTLVEEFLHLRHGYEDCTREMQNYLFDRLMSLGEELVGEPL